MHKISEAQTHLHKNHIDGWLLFDFHRRNHFACQFLEIPEETHLTRRFFYWIPREGDPIKIVHAVESSVLDHLPGAKKIYQTWESFDQALREVLQDKKVIAMEYSPRNRIPYVSLVDAGLVELIRESGVQVVSSGAFLQHFTCVWNKRQLELHLEAANHLNQIVNQTWKWIGHNLQNKRKFSEYDVQQFILNEIVSGDCITEGAPICAVNANAADPHYSPSPKTSFQVKYGDFILIDLWCKKKQKDAVYADIARVAVLAPKASPQQEEIFQVVRRSQKKALDFLEASLQKGKVVKGYEVDRVCRKEIEDAGYGKYFIHRTGHNIHTDVHGPGANLDSFETLDERPLIAKTCFSVEPGIYLPGQFGVRLETNVYIDESGKIQVTGGIQDKMVCI